MCRSNGEGPGSFHEAEAAHEDIAMNSPAREGAAGVSTPNEKVAAQADGGRFNLSFEVVPEEPKLGLGEHHLPQYHNGEKLRGSKPCLGQERGRDQG